MNLIIDVGNTAVKLAVFENGKIIAHKEASLSEMVEKARDLTLEFGTIDAIDGLICSINTP